MEGVFSSKKKSNNISHFEFWAKSFRMGRHNCLVRFHSHSLRTDLVVEKNYVFTFNFALGAGIFQTAGEKFLRVGGNCMLLVQRKLLTANYFFDWMFLFKKCFGAQTKLFEDSVTKFLRISVQIVSTCPWQRSD